MKYLRQSAIVFGILSFASAQVAAAPATHSFPKSGMKAPVSNVGIIQDSAVEALRSMSNYLMQQQTLQISTVGSLDVVTDDGQRIQLDGTTTYKIKRPGFVIDYVSDIKSRRFIYDGKTFTVYSPKLGYYASVPAPATNKEVLDTIYNKFGISLPLVDLFRWGEGTSADRVKALKSAYDVGPATIEADVDWKVLIDNDDQPLPRKLVIVDRTVPARPTFSTRLTWQVNPTFTEADFAFVPDADAKRIQLATYKGGEK